jgi:hypothetical protein
MNIDYLNKKNISNLDQVRFNSLRINGTKKIEERMCYDSYWEVYTNYGTVTLKMYDGIDEEDILWKCRRCKNIYELLEIQPKVFYYD